MHALGKALPRPWHAAIAMLFLSMLAPRMHAGLHVEIEGVRLPVQMRGDEPYVSLGGFAAARFLEYEYSYIENTYVLRSPQPGGKVSILRFRPGEPVVTVDDQARELRVPPLEGSDSLLVPLHDFAALILGPREAAAIQLRPDEGPAARLIGVTPLPRQGYTKLLFDWEGSPQARVRRLPERAEVEVLFAGSRLGEVPTSLEVNGPYLRSLHLSEDPDLLQVRAVLVLSGPVGAEGFFLESSHQYVLTLAPGRSQADPAFDMPETVGAREKAYLATQRLGIDPSHGGNDLGAEAPQGRSEAALALALAHDLRRLCEATGLPTELVREDARLVPMHTRLHQLNGAGYSAVLSLHARSQQPSHVSTLPIFFVLPDPAPAPSAPPAPPTSDPELADALDAALGPSTPEVQLPDLDALRRPNQAERDEARRLAARLASSVAERLGAQVPVLEDPTLLPHSRVLAPGVAVDVGPLEVFAAPEDPSFEADPLRRRAAFALYQGVLAYFRERARRQPAPPPPPQDWQLQRGLRDDILNSPDEVPPEWRPLGEP